MSGSTNFFVAADPKQSSEKRVSQFRQWTNRSRILNMVRGRRYLKKKLTKRQMRDAALMREGYREQREKEKFYQ